MGAWGTGILSDDLAMDIRREYSVLLSVGKRDEEAEEMLINYYASILNCNDPDEDVFWFSLALCEWKKGRLSLAVKEKALSALNSGRDLERWNTAGNEKNYKKRKKTLSELKETLLSPMPPAKKIKKPTVHHCPWKVGSLLAYRIVSHPDYLQGRPCHGKYVLLRVVRIAKHPVSNLFDTEYYDESMLVGLYNWIGSEIPDPQIVHSLKYIPVNEAVSRKPTGPINLSILDELPEEARKKALGALLSLFYSEPEKCEWLNWRSYKNEQGDITLLDCDDDFEKNLPDFFKPAPRSSTYTHFWPMDITLSKKFDPHLEAKGNPDSLII